MILLQILVVFHLVEGKLDLTFGKIAERLHVEKKLIQNALPTKNITHPRNKMINWRNRSRNSRKNSETLLPDLIGIDLSNFNYACHCRNFQNFEQITSAPAVATQGQPIDEIDKLCRFLHNGWSCLAALDNCSLDETYALPDVSKMVTEGWSIEMLLADCLNKNQGYCKQQLCQVETNFSIEMISLVTNNLYDQDLSDKNGFDTEYDCPNLNHRNTCLYGSNKCCSGEYPYKWIEWICVPQKCPMNRDRLRKQQAEQRKHDRFRRMIDEARR